MWIKWVLFLRLAIISGMARKLEFKPQANALVSVMAQNNFFRSYFVTGNIPKSVSEPCKLYLVDFMEDLESRKMSAIQMVDAFGKIPGNILRGHLQWIGSYDECANIANNSANYCITKLSTSDALASIQQSPALATCLPRQCGPADITAIVDDLIGYIKKLLPQPVPELDALSARDTTCEPDLPVEWGFYLFFVIIAVLVILNIFGTLVDGYVLPRLHAAELSRKSSFTESGEEDEPLLQDATADGIEVNPLPARIRAILCFSVARSWRYLTADREDELSFLNGIRVLSICWVVLAEFGNLGEIAYENPLDYLDSAGTIFGQLITNFSFAADTFFIVSGTVLTYTLMTKLKVRSGKINWIWIYLRRWWRLTPLYVFLLVICIFVVPQLVSGPFPIIAGQDSGGNPIDFCKQNWWANVLYVNNFIPTNTLYLCMDWTWFIAVDMQLFLITPVIVYVLYRLPKIGTAATMILIAGCVVANGLIAGHWGLPVTVNEQPIYHNETYDPNHDYVNSKPYTRATPYLLGILIGFLFAQKAEWHCVRPKLRFAGVSFVWILSCLTGLFTVFGLYQSYSWPNGATYTERETYQTLSRLGYSLAVGWVLVACRYGSSGPIKSILSWNIFKPLSRLTFAVYMFHPLVVQYFLISQRDPFYYNGINFAYLYLSMLFISHLLATILAVFVEIPLLRLEKEVFGSKR
ncbi:nose resistant to fluoxetine protein 6-like [Paramacrobiotus metropolitanus]|uniref:nose resistant to fluoxetine protein 6-like n=1 Tax=Paramacrobiotus metropolitanus TaxID=2943436 RepID=UPI0024461F1B|nr:nose resistant to fluoxetine protein 6-like [Paramacrobiotus metropolitanus]